MSAPPGFDLQPTLEGPRVLIRPVTPADFDDLFAAASDPAIWKLHPQQDRYTEAVFRDYFQGAIDSGSAFVFVDRDSNRIIGSSRYHGYDPDKSEIEIGWTFLSRAYWGGDYNREIKQLMLEHAFRFVDTVVFWVGESNHRSRKAMEKIGGVLRDGVQYREGIADPHVVYEIRKTDGG